MGRGHFPTTSSQIIQKLCKNIWYLGYRTESFNSKCAYNTDWNFGVLLPEMGLYWLAAQGLSDGGMGLARIYPGAVSGLLQFKDYNCLGRLPVWDSQRFASDISGVSLEKHGAFTAQEGEQVA